MPAMHDVAFQGGDTLRPREPLGAWEQARLSGVIHGRTTHGYGRSHVRVFSDRPPPDAPRPDRESDPTHLLETLDV